MVAASALGDSAAVAATCGARAAPRYGVGYANGNAGDWGVTVSFDVVTSPVCDPQNSPNRNLTQVQSATQDGSYFTSAGYLRHWGGQTVTYSNQKSTSGYRIVEGCAVPDGATVKVDSSYYKDTLTGVEYFGYSSALSSGGCYAYLGQLSLSYYHTDWLFEGLDFVASDVPGTAANHVNWRGLAFYNHDSPNVNPRPYPCGLSVYADSSRFSHHALSCTAFDLWTQ